MLVANNIYKSFGDLNVLRGVDLKISKAEIISIVGKSGSGKSTLLHILGTLDQADSGEVILNDIAFNKLNEKDLSSFRNKHVGFIFQFHHLLAEFTALENVCIPAYILGLTKNESAEKAKKLLKYLGMSDREHHKPSQLSGGEQQRVAVARSLMNSPDIVFADEPSGNLDLETSEELHQLLFKLRNDFQQTFVIVTHNQELAKMSDRCLELVGGKLDNFHGSYK
jgi:lipoprotein-releasing system ATP-binding protein